MSYLLLLAIYISVIFLMKLLFSLVLILLIIELPHFPRYNVTLSNCTIGDLCVIHNGVCIGQDGNRDYYKLGSVSCS